MLVGSQKYEIGSCENGMFDEIKIKDQKDRDFQESAGNIKRCGTHTFKCQISCFSLFIGSLTIITFRRTNL